MNRKYTFESSLNLAAADINSGLVFLQWPHPKTQETWSIYLICIATVLALTGLRPGICLQNKGKHVVLVESEFNYTDMVRDVFLRPSNVN